MTRDCHNHQTAVSPIYGKIFTGIILLTHCSFLITSQTFGRTSNVPFEIFSVVLLQCFISTTILIRRCSPIGVRILAILFIGGEWIRGLPFSNHHVLLAATSFAFILCRNDRQLRASLRALLLVVYLLTFVYKLNSSFVDPAQSCVHFFIENTSQSLFGVPAAASILKEGPVLVLAAELAIPVLLLIERLRPLALLVGLLFHSALALDIPKHFFDFSAVMIGLLCIVCIPWVSSERSPRRKLLLQCSTTLLVLLPILSFCRLLFPRFPLHEGDLLTLGTLLLLFLLPALVIYLRPVWSLRQSSPDRLERLRPTTLMPAVLMGIICLGPILGFRTRFSMDMYSGLELTATSSNHLFIPRSLDLFGYLNDFVLLEAADSAKMQKSIELTDSYMPFLELRRLFADNPSASLRFIRGEQIIEVSPQSPYPPLATPLDFWERNFIVFRPHSVPGKEKCRW